MPAPCAACRTAPAQQCALPNDTRTWSCTVAFGTLRLVAGIGAPPMADRGSGGVGAEDHLDAGFGARSLVVTEYHFLLLAGDRLSAVNRVNGRTVQALAFRSPLTRNVSGEPSREIGKRAVCEAMFLVIVRHMGSALCSLLGRPLATGGHPTPRTALTVSPAPCFAPVQMGWFAILSAGECECTPSAWGL